MIFKMTQFDEHSRKKYVSGSNKRGSIPLLALSSNKVRTSDSFLELLPRLNINFNSFL